MKHKSVISVLILCMCVVSLVIPVFAGSGGYVSANDDDNYHPIVTIPPAGSPAPTPKPTGSPSPEPTVIPPPGPTVNTTPLPTVSPTPGTGASGPLSLTGAVSRNVTLSYIASGVTYGHAGTYMDSSGVTWEGMPLWFLAGMVDDTTQHGAGAFNDTLAASGYSIVVTGRDGTSVTLDSKKVTRNSGYLIANTKNGVTIPATDPAAPLVLVGNGTGIGNGVTGVTGISLRFGPGTPLPTPSPTQTQVPTVSPIPTGTPSNSVTPTVSLAPVTTFSLSGAASRTIDMGYFTRGMAYGHTSSYRDGSGVTWEGMPLWFLAGMVDDSNQHGAGAFNDALAAQGYSITVAGRDGTSVNLDGKAVSRSNAYLVANKKNGIAITATDPDAPVRLVGNGAGIGNGVSGITSISLTFGATPTPTSTVTPTETPTVTPTQAPVNGTSWNISVEGKMNKIVTKSWFEGGVIAGHGGTYTDPDGKAWQGIPLWYFTGLSDDNKQHGVGAFNDPAAEAGYTITVTGRDNTSITLDSRNITRTSLYLVANKVNGGPLPATDKNAPIVLVGPEIPSSKMIGGVNRIVLTFPGYTNTISLSENTRTAGSAVPTGAETLNKAAETLNKAAEKPAPASVPAAGFGWMPTFTFRIAFTPFPEILIQFGQPPLADSNSTTRTPAIASASGSSPVSGDTLVLTGAISDTIPVKRVQDGIDYGHKGEYTDAEGNTYIGKPLWFFAGWVDDQNSHSAGAFNDDVASKGYNITVTGRDSETMISSTDIMRSDGYLIATTKNGNRLTTDNGGPLMLVGNSVPVEYRVAGVSAIALDLPNAE
jgi:hypothetical protein